MDQLAFNEVHFHYLAVDARTQRHNMPVHLRIVGVFVEERVADQIPGNDQRVKRQSGVTHPAEAVIPVANATN